MNDDTMHQVRLSEPYVSGNLRCQPWWVIVKTLAEGEKKEWARADSLHKEVERLRAELAAKQSAALCVKCDAPWDAHFAPDQGGCPGFVAEAAQQGPSDEEIREAIEKVDRSITTTEAVVYLTDVLRKVARRAGVKL